MNRRQRCLNFRCPQCGVPRGVEKELEEAQARIEGLQREARGYAESLDNIRAALGQEVTHHLVMAGDVEELVRAIEHDANVGGHRAIGVSSQASREGQAVPRINCEQRMREFLEDLETASIGGDLRGIELDTREECVEDWSRDYAIGLIDIVGPETSIVPATFIDVDTIVDAIVARAAKRFGKTFEVVRGRGEAKSNQVLHVHRIGSWTIELEAYRRIEKEEDQCDES